MHPLRYHKGTIAVQSAYGSTRPFSGLSHVHIRLNSFNANLLALYMLDQYDLLFFSLQKAVTIIVIFCICPFWFVDEEDLRFCAISRRSSLWSGLVLLPVWGESCYRGVVLKVRAVVSFRNFSVDISGPILPYSQHYCQQNNNVQISTQERWKPHSFYIFSLLHSKIKNIVALLT